MSDTIVIVGGAGGIGSSIVKKYAEEGHNVIIGDIDADSAEDLASKYDSVRFFPVDVRNYDSASEDLSIVDFRKMVEKEAGPVTHLISLAGFSLPDEGKGLAGSSGKTIDDSIDLNLKSHLYLLKEFAPSIYSSGSDNRSVVLVSSINAIQDYSGPAYSAAKAGLLGVVNSTVMELGERGVRINAVLPGTTITKRTEDETPDYKKLVKGTALKRLTTPEEVAETVYAITHLMTCVTGQGIIADCGQTKVSATRIL